MSTDSEVETLMDMSRLSRPLPRYVKVWMADLIMAFADVEGEAEQFIWAYTGIDPRHGKVITGMDARKKFEILQKLAAEHMNTADWKEATKHIWKQLQELSKLRNLLAHGMLHMLDNSQVAAVSFRKGPLADTVVATLIAPSRIEFNIGVANHIRTLFHDLAVKYREMPRSEPDAPPPSET